MRSLAKEISSLGLHIPRQIIIVENAVKILEPHNSHPIVVGSHCYRIIDGMDTLYVARKP